MGSGLKKFAVSAALIAQLVSASAIAAIPRSNIYGTDFSRVIQPLESVHEIKTEDVARWIPVNMAPSDDGSAVASQIFDFGVQNLLKSPDFKNNSLVRSAQKMESVMGSDMSFGGTQAGDTKHVFKFRMKPTQSAAQLNYEGLVNARVDYQIARSALNVEISEKVATHTDLVITHADTRNDRREMLSMRWSF
ncbi:MAG: hypothetical protein NDI61_00795 [Bdellovibrionaceae bacterium]|nr:hypothetical protein [Pseudobdellovibrionaceae bacterium]